MAAGSKRDGVLKGGGLATADLETAAIFVGNEPAACVRSGRCAFRFSQTGRFCGWQRVNGSPVRSRVFENDVNYVRRKLHTFVCYHDH